jgi:hypothetical protein
MWKALEGLIISLRGKVLTHKTSLIPPLFIEVCQENYNRANSVTIKNVKYANTFWQIPQDKSTKSEITRANTMGEMNEIHSKYENARHTPIQIHF